jgi:hypothetical protein
MLSNEIMRLRSAFIGAVVLLTAGIVPMPALAVGCTNAPAGVTTECTDTCASGYIVSTSLGDISSFVNASCTGGAKCCVQIGTAACNAEAKAGKGASGICKASCGGIETASARGADISTCPAGQKCCVTKASAAVTGSSVALPDPLAGLNIPLLIGNIIRTFAGVAGSIALLMFAWGGINYILSGGESDKVKKAKATLLNATIGLVLILFAYSFVSAIIDTLLAPSTDTAQTQTTTPNGQ